ncbi:MAG: glucosamine-6-phosphate deaminase [Gemmatimonadota bacterium]
MARPREHIPVVIAEEHDEIARLIADRIEALIRQKQDAGERVVLGLATGSTPIGIYRDLIRRHGQGLSFANVVTFNLDEYYPMEPDSIHSYHRYMWENFFEHIDIPADQVHIPQGDVARSRVERHCREYEAKIREAGGIDYQILGIGQTGHIGFNEPGSGLESRTRLVALDTITRRTAAADFFGEDNVPMEAITMGVATILEAREIALIATGEHKAAIVHRAVEGERTPDVAATYLQQHPDATIYLDAAAAAELTRIKTPWTLGEVEWTRDLEIRALSGKRIIVFSPHPDDDVISAGGILNKLQQNGNHIVVAYQTSGNIAVFDHEVRRYLDFMRRASEDFGLGSADIARLIDEVEAFLATKRPGQVDSDDVLRIKRRIREAEAVSGIATFGMAREQARFLNMPFYQTGKVRKEPIGELDIRIVLELLEDQRPELLLVAGDLTDPHGTHRMCKEAIEAALERYPGEPPEVWYYRGAWQEWPIAEADVLVPLSKQELRQKVFAIFKHQSQKDKAPFPGLDEREFWQRVEERNRTTARVLDELGLPAYYAMEAYVVRKAGQPLEHPIIPTSALAEPSEWVPEPGESLPETG